MKLCKVEIPISFLEFNNFKKITFHLSCEVNTFENQIMEAKKELEAFEDLE
jgi:hypothetical protein